MKLGERLDLELSWKRVREDLRDYSFVDYPFLPDLIETNLDNWLTELRGTVLAGTYNPMSCRVIYVPKVGWHLRPGHILTLEDSVMYTALVLDAVERIRDGVCWSANTIRFSNILREDQTGKQWFGFAAQAWTNFSNASVQKIENGMEFVLFSDLSSFYENIDLQRLYDDLKYTRVPEDNLRLLLRCLYRWSEPRMRGIPQSFRPSDVLAEVYLNTIDKRLNTEGIEHLRYSDDLVIFCSSERAAILSLQLLTKLYREKGLNLQTAKSFIRRGDDAIEELRGASGTIPRLRDEIGKEVMAALKTDNPYSTPSELRRLVEQGHVNLRLESLKKYLDVFFLSGKYPFDKRLFHYIINRLAVLGDPSALEYCFEVLETHPEETKSVLGYFSDMQQKPEIADELARLILDDEIFMEYTIYLILRWLWIERLSSEPLLSMVRILLNRSGVASPCTQYCLAYLGEFGTDADLERIESLYREMSDEISRSTVICSLRRMEKGRRNSILERARLDSKLIGLAVNWVKSH